MSLMNLLTAGRSLSEAREQPHRYKLRTGALPKFGNSAAQEPSGDGNEVVAGSQTMKTQMVAEPTVQRTTRERWALPKNLFKSGRAPVPRPVVQGELSLDKVKPVRNDLSDTDLELVAVSKRIEPAPSAVKIESVEVPVVKIQAIFERVRGLFQRAK